MRSFTAILILLAALCGSGEPLKSERLWKHVLVLHSYDQNYPFTAAESAGINSVLSPESTWLEQHVVHMDSKRITGEAYHRALADLLRIQLAGIKLDAVLTTDNDAFDFVAHHRDVLFPGVPVFFCGIDSFHEGMLGGRRDITGVVEHSDYAETIDLALRLRPSVKQIVAVTDNTTTGRVHAEAVRRLAPAYESRARLVILSLEDHTLADACERLAALGADSVVLLLSHHRDRNGHVFAHSHSIEMLSGSCLVPIFIINETRLGWGAVGGRLIRGQNHGRLAAEMMLRALKGEDISSLPIVTASPNEWMFDYRALQRWQIRESDLPAGSVVINRPVSFYAQHRAAILGALAACLVLVLIIWMQAAAIIRRNAAERALLRSTEQLRQSQKMEAIGRLAGGVAHDFNNLLTAILGYGEMAMEQAPAGSPLQGQLREILRAGGQAASLTRQLLAFSRKQVVAPVVLDLNELISRSRRMLDRIVGEDIELLFHQQADLGHIKADPGQIEQIIVNLAANARDAMPRGGKLIFETSNVDIDEQYCRSHNEALAGRWVMLAASDTGQGMTSEVRAHLFEPFFTTKELGKGTGLGLATVYGIMKQNGGFINVYSEPGVGSTFKLFFPLVAEPVTPVPRAAAEALPPGQATILLVEDDASVRELVRATLSQRGYGIRAAADAEEAIALFAANPAGFDLLITDVVMPRINGKQLFDRLLAIRPTLKAIFMSGYTENVIAQHGILDAGIQFIQKPFGIDQLGRKVHDVLAQDSGTPGGR